MKKIIKGSRRGLTFSFPSEGKLKIGSYYDYIVDKANRNIKIVPAEKGRYKLSRKKTKSGWNALVDLRNREILETLKGIDQLRISQTGDEIIVSSAKKKAAKSGNIILRFPRFALSDLRMAVGIDDNSAISNLFTGAQITLDEYLASRSMPISVPSIHDALPDVYTVVSLFSGAGILDWPFAQDKRFDIKYAIDYDEAACRTYRHNIGLHITHGDIHRAFTSAGYVRDSQVKDPDIIIGGPSCKPFSNANRHTRLQDHKDSDLVVQYMRIVKTLKPKVWVMENVPEVLTACDGSYFKSIQELASETGYEVGAKIVQDNKVGGYTTRRRVIILGSRIGKVTFSNIFSTKGKTVGDALSLIDSSWSNFADVNDHGKDTVKRMSFVPQGGNYKDIPSEYQTPSKNRHSCTYRRLSLSEPAPTIVNWRKPPLIHPTENRTLTVAEAKALQGLPGNFRILGSLSQMQQQVGNSVPVAIGRYIKALLVAMLQSHSGQNQRLCTAF